MSAKSETWRARRAARAALKAAAIAATAAAVPVSAHAQTLDETWRTAITTSPDIEVQRAALRSLDEGVAAARAGLRPNVNATGSAGLNRTDSSEAPKPTYREPFSLSVTVTQPLYDGGQTQNGVESAEASVRSGRFSLLETEQTVLLNALIAHARVLEAQRNVGLANNNVAVNRRTLQAARDRFEVGEVTRTDVAQAEAALAQAQANLTTQQGLLGQRQQDYARFVGMLPTGLRALPPLPELPASLEEALQIAEESRPTILAAKADVEAASAAVRQAVGATLPQVDLQGTGSAAANSVNRGSGVFTLDGAVQVTVPIYQGGSLRSAVRNQQAQASRSRAQLQLTVRDVRREVGIAWQNLVTARSSIRSNQEQVRAQEIAFEGVRQEAAVGSRTTLDVVEAEQDLLDARVALVGSQTDLTENAYTLLSSMGVLTVAKVGLDVPNYDAESAYQQAQQFNAGWPEDDDTEWRKNWRP